MPILNQIRLNEEQTRAVDALRQGQVAVTAGAGTGKTRTLVAAYLMLLEETDDVRRIAAVTFTRKAAHEMRNRVRQEIRGYLQAEELPAAERQRWEEHYRRLDAARIGTIHSLCADILRTHPAEAAVDPAFAVLEESDAARFQALAIADALAWGSRFTDTAALFTLLGERELRTLLGTLLGSRLETKQALDACGDDPLAYWRRQLDQEKEQALGSCLAEVAELLAGVNQYRAADPDDLLEQRRSEAEQLVRRAQAARQAGETDKAVGALLELSGLSHSGGSKRQWDEEEREIVRQALKAAKEAVANYPVLQSRLNQADEEAALLLPPLKRLFEQAALGYGQLKERQQALDFDDLEEQALELLHKAAPRAYWQEQLRALLVDEYQDTNDRQRQLINRLSRQGRRFIVGDAKQSIYRFRGADVAVFNEEQEAIGRAGGRLVALQTSYRARPPLLDLLNLLLEPALHERHPQPYHAPFTALHAPEPQPASGQQPALESPFLELHLALGNQSGGADRAAAQALAERVQQLVETVPHLAYGDVAVLCRAVSAFEPYEEAFVSRNIPYITSSGSGFYQRPEIRDLLNALQAIARPADELALVGLLRSPVCGLSDVDLHNMAQREEEEWWQRLAATPLPQAKRAYRLLEGLRREAPLLPAARLLARFLEETDYLAALERAGQPRAVRNVRKLLVDLEQSGHTHLNDYLQWTEEVRQSDLRAGEAPAAAANAVHLLTVHAAKGLEFEVVAIGHINYAPRGRTAPLIQAERGLLLPLGDDKEQRPALYQLGYEQEQKEDDAERRRLLYVAATRARQKLLLSGYFRGLKQDGTPGYLSDWLKWLAEPLALNKKPIAGAESSQPLAVTGLALDDTACTIYPPGWVVTPAATTAPDKERVSPNSHAPLQDPLPATGPPALEPMERPWYVVDRDEGSEPARLVGTLVHEALASWRFPGDKNFERWLEARACAAGLVTTGRQQAAVARAALLLHRFRESKLFATVDAAAVRYHELPYYLSEGSELPGSHSIDLLYRAKDGAWVILDFKTNQLPGGTDLNRWCRETVEDGRSYFAQLAEYAGALQRLLPLAERPTASLCLLDYEGQVRLFTPS